MIGTEFDPGPAIEVDVLARRLEEIAPELAERLRDVVRQQMPDSAQQVREHLDECPNFLLGKAGVWAMELHGEIEDAVRDYVCLVSGEGVSKDEDFEDEIQACVDGMKQHFIDNLF